VRVGSLHSEPGRARDRYSGGGLLWRGGISAGGSVGVYARPRRCLRSLRVLLELGLRGDDPSAAGGAAHLPRPIAAAPDGDVSRSERWHRTTWINIGASPYANASANMNKYWAALQPTSTAAPLVYVLYIHHSISRKTANGSNFLAFGGYQPLYNNGSPTSPKYSENRTLCLPAQSQHYLVQWIDPRNGGILAFSKIPGNSSCGTPITSPNYAFDIVLKVSQVP
jgi:hypothetical protein